MMKTLYILPVILASGLAVATEAGALVLDNGRNVNGRNVNGGSLNGRNINGLDRHGATDEAPAVKAVTVILKDGARVTLQ